MRMKTALGVVASVLFLCGFIASAAAVTSPSIAVSISVAPLDPGDSITLPNEKAGSSPIPMGISIRNVGDAELELTDDPPVTLSGSGAAAFTIKDQPQTRLDPGDQTSFAIVFRPAAPGSYDAMISIASNDPKFPRFSFYVSATQTR